MRPSMWPCERDKVGAGPLGSPFPVLVANPLTIDAPLHYHFTPGDFPSFPHANAHKNFYNFQFFSVKTLVETERLSHVALKACTLKATEPPVRKAGSVAELVGKLKNEAGIL
jgi:hypothetical protein